MTSVARREFLAGVAAVATGANPRQPARRDDAESQAEASPFEWGVASFDPSGDGVLLWTRATPTATGPAPLEWVVARDAALTDVVATGRIEVGPDTDHCAVVAVDGLEPGRTWWYAFTTSTGERSPVGRTRTMPTGPVERLRLGVVSCSRYASGGFEAYRALAAREVDLVVHLGDYIYEDGLGGAREHQPAHRLRALADYRARYAQHRRDPDLQALHARHPMVAVGDDHDVAGNAWRDGAATHDPSVDGPWIDRLLAAGHARSEWVPGRTGASDADGRPRAWRTIGLGTLAELVVLDTRTWGRDRQPATAAELGGPPPGGADGTRRTMLGADQERFVADRLRGVDGDRPPWVVLANQVMFHPLRVAVPTPSLAGAIEAAGFLVVDGEAVNADQWDGYPQAREALSVAMGGGGGVVMLTGDVHSSWAWEGPANDGGRPAMVELVAPSVSSEALADRLPVAAGLVETALRGLSPDLSHVELSSHGYLLVDLTADQVQGEWWYVEPGVRGSQRFGAGRTAPRSVPMHLTEVAVPLRDPAVTVPPAVPPTLTPAADGDPRDEVGAPVVLGGVAALVAAGAAAAVALRRRRA